MPLASLKSSQITKKEGERRFFCLLNVRESGKIFHLVRFLVTFFLVSNRVQRAKSPPLGFLTTLEASSP